MAMITTDQGRAAGCFDALLALALGRSLSMSRTKVAKLLYLADLRSVEEDGKQGSGIAWRWRDRGPFDDALFAVERSLVAQNKIESKTSWWGVGANKQVDLTAKSATPSMLAGTDSFLRHIEFVLDEYGSCTARRLTDIAYGTQPMVEAQENDDREGLLDLGEAVPAIDISNSIIRYQMILDNHPADDDTPIDNSCLTDEFGILAEERARATREML